MNLMYIMTDKVSTGGGRDCCQILTSFGRCFLTMTGSCTEWVHCKVLHMDGHWTLLPQKSKWNVPFVHNVRF